MKKLRSSPMPDLTEDLVEEILVRVPATSLNRLRSACKQWNALLNDGRFTKKHFDKAEKKYLDLSLRGLRVSSMTVNLRGLDDNIDPCIEFKGELNLNHHLLYNSGKVVGVEVFHCNGLLLCTDLSTIVVWNPCTGQTKWIETKNRYTRYDYALGYENKKSCHNYKIMRLLHSDTFEMEVYEFNSNSWRVLDSVIGPDFVLHMQAGGMSVKGNTYWLAYDIDHKDEEEFIINWFLISFDFTTERFGPHVCLPFQDLCYNDVMALSSVREERLSVLFQDKDAPTIEIWLTNDITETNVITWSKLLRIDLNTPRLLYNGSATFFIDEENKVAVIYIHSSVYISGQDRYWRTVELDGPLWLHMFCYVPSLVRI